MAAMAADAEQRYQKRQKNLKIATELKEKGNIALKENRFEDAEKRSVPYMKIRRSTF